MTEQIFAVGGAIRDALLGLPVKDRDWVVVGSTPEQMAAQGYLPVGKDFPVFLHPVTRQEYALARTERKTARGYKGFAVHASPEVTLDEDLARRDLTVNAMAVAQVWMSDAPSAEQLKPHLHDPYGGLQDLQRQVLRHVTPAFREDPVRIMRVARFAARFPDFSVAPETMELMREMVLDGEVDHLVPERVWQELARGLMGAKPSRMLEVLRACGALKVLLPEVDRLWGVPQRPEYHPEIDTGAHLMLVLDMSAQLQQPLAVRVACLCHDLGKGNTPADLLPRHIGHEQRSVRLLQGLAERLRMPVDCRELAEVVAREHGNIHRSGEFNAAAVLRLLLRCDALRQPDRMQAVLWACECDARGRWGLQDAPYPQRQRLSDALTQVLAVPTAPIAAQAQAEGLTGPAVGERIQAARLQALSQWTASPNP